MLPILVRRREIAAALGCLGFLLIGWSSLLVPALVRSIEGDFRVSDADLGLFYLVNAVAYAAGSVGGGMLTERVGRRGVLASAAVLHGLGLAAQGLVPSWGIFLLAGIPRGFGSGAIDGGVNGLVLDLYPHARGRALNAVHLFFSLGALGSPLAVGLLSGGGVPWQALVNGTALVSFPLAIAMAVADLAGGRRHAARAAAERPRRPGLVVALPLVLLGAAIACYVSSEMGVSNWLVRFLAAAPVTVASSALGLYWAGLTLGRLVSARLADQVDHLALAVWASLLVGLTIAGAVVVPSIPASIALFGVCGVASGPIYPLIMAIGGERFPARTAAVSGLLAGAAVAGSVVYPPAMGFLSVTVGLPAAMLGTALLGFGCAAALVAVGRLARASAARGSSAA